MCKFSTQPRPVAKITTPVPLVRIELTTPANLVHFSQLHGQVSVESYKIYTLAQYSLPLNNIYIDIYIYIIYI